MRAKLRVALTEPHPHMAPLISNYQDGLTTIFETQIVERHLLECERCHDFYGSLRQAQTDIHELASVSLSDEGERAAYNDLLSRIDRRKGPNSRPSYKRENQSVKRRGKSMKGLRQLINSQKNEKPELGFQNFDRFTTRALKVLNIAQAEAKQFNHDYIGTEHLLLGLIMEEGGLASIALHKLGVELEIVQKQVVEIIGRGQEQPMAVGDIRLTPRSKKVIQLGVVEARELNHDFIGTEHLLLGLLREGEGVGVDILEKLNISPVKVREEVIALINQGKDH